MAFYVWLLAALLDIGLLSRLVWQFACTSRASLKRSDQRFWLATALFFGLVVLAGAVALLMLPLP